MPADSSYASGHFPSGVHRAEGSELDLSGATNTLSQRTSSALFCLLENAAPDTPLQRTRAGIVNLRFAMRRATAFRRDVAAELPVVSRARNLKEDP